MKMDNIKQFYKEEFNRKSSFQKIFDSDHKFLKPEFSWNKKFQAELLKFLKDHNIIDSVSNNLKQLHCLIDKKYLKFNLLSDKNNNSRPIISDILFDFSVLQEKLYHDFLKWIYRDVIKEDFYFQRTPTIRVHMPEVKVISLPAWHSDCFFGHSPRNINIWFGLTDNKKSDFWIKSVEDSVDWFEDFNCDIEKWSDICFGKNEEFSKAGFKNAFEVGDIFDSVFLFDGRCIHTADYRSSRDETTKISIDMRILLVDDYEWKILDNKPVFKGKGIKEAEFRPGHPYVFHEKSIKEILSE